MPRSLHQQRSRRMTPPPPTAVVHPADCFSALRFSVKLPGPSSFPLRQDGLSRDADANSELEADNDTDVDADDAGQLQSVELCFHYEFISTHEPISLHFDACGASSIVQYRESSLVVPTPTPPRFIHEFPAILDLTVPPSSPDPAIQGTTAGRDAALHVEMVPARDNISSFLSSPLLPSFYGRSRRQSSSPIVLSSTPSLGLALSLAFGLILGFLLASLLFMVTKPIHRRILTIDRLRLSLIEPLQDLVGHHADADFFRHFDSLTQDVCLKARILISAQASKSHTREDVLLTCDHIGQRTILARSLWSDLGAQLHSERQRIVENLGFTARMLRNMHDAPESNNVTAVYRLTLLNAQLASWIESCHLCHPPPPRPVAPPPHAAPPSLRDEVAHYACDPALAPLFVSVHNNSNAVEIQSHLLRWALARSERRRMALRRPLIDLDGKPLFPNNQHPYDEADDVQETRLDDESTLLALTRHTLELYVALDELLAQLAQHVLGNALQQQHFHDALASPWEADFEHAIRDGAALLADIRDTSILPHARRLSHASAGMARACVLLGELEAHIDELHRAGGQAPPRVAVAAGTLRDGTAPAHVVPPTVTIDVVHARYTADVDGEVSALEEASLAAASWTLPSHPTAPPLTEGLPLLVLGEQVAPLPNVKLEEDSFALEYRRQLGILGDRLGFKSKGPRSPEWDHEGLSDD
ncbi:hypothetical protein EsH8_XI_000091 [Colletotrichum jinshuiense]